MTDIILLQKGDLKSSDFTNDNTNNRQGIGIRLSTDNGNLLQKRANGLYYGVEAPPDTRYMYVSSSMGDDRNKGNRAKPLKTIGEAFKRNQVGTEFRIYLFEDDIHDWKSSWQGHTQGKIVSFRPYGDTMDKVSAANPRGSMQYYRSKEIKRPTIRFISDTEANLSNEIFSTMRGIITTTPAQGVIRFFAIKFDATVPAPKEVFPKPGRDYYVQTISFLGNDLNPMNIHFVGCDFKLSDHFNVIMAGGNTTVIVDACVFDVTNGTRFLDIVANTQLNLTFGGLGTVDGTLVQHTVPDTMELHLRGNTQKDILKQIFKRISAQSTHTYNTRSNINIFE